MGQVVHLASAQAVDDAWQAYVEQAALLVANPALLCNRAFNEECTRRHERWRRLFLIQEAGR
jgi:hypothetical protein